MPSRKKLRARGSDSSISSNISNASNASTRSTAGSVGGMGVSSVPNTSSKPGHQYIANPGNTSLQIHERQICTNCSHIAGYHYLIEEGGRCNAPEGCGCAGLKVNQ